MKASRVITHDRPSLAGRGSCDDPGCSDHPYATLTPHYGCPACGQSWSVLVTETKEDLAGWNVEPWRFETPPVGEK